MDTLENLRRKIESAGEVRSVVRTMKAMAASSIGQYEMATVALSDYYHAVLLGLTTYFKKNTYHPKRSKAGSEESIVAIVFGSDQGLVGQFNYEIAQFTLQFLNKQPGQKEIWVVGEQALQRFTDVGLSTGKVFPVPNSLSAITSLVERILLDIESDRENGKARKFYMFHNQLESRAVYHPVVQQLLPLDAEWENNFKQSWPTSKIPEIVGSMETTLTALIREYLFVSVYRACAESLASENASRLESMQRAQKNIDDMLDELNKKYYLLRQNSIDEELFDIVLGFEAFKGEHPIKR